MIFSILIVSVIFLFLSWIVFVPLHVTIDTTRDRYEFSQTGTFTFSIRPFTKPSSHLLVFGFPINLKQTKERKVPKETKLSKPRTKKSLAAWLFLIGKIPSCIKVRHLRCTIDFNDVVLNAQLVPILYFISAGSVNVTTNFTGQYYLKLMVDIKLNRLLWTFVKFSTKH